LVVFGFLLEEVKQIILKRKDNHGSYQMDFRTWMQQIYILQAYITHLQPLVPLVMVILVEDASWKE